MPLFSQYLLYFNRRARALSHPSIKLMFIFHPSKKKLRSVHLFLAQCPPSATSRIPLWNCPVKTEAPWHYFGRHYYIFCPLHQCVRWGLVTGFAWHSVGIVTWAPGNFWSCPFVVTKGSMRSVLEGVVDGAGSKGRFPLCLLIIGLFLLHFHFHSCSLFLCALLRGGSGQLSGPRSFPRCSSCTPWCGCPSLPSSLLLCFTSSVLWRHQLNIVL